MTEKPLAIRFPKDLIARLDAAADALSERAAGARVTRSDAIRAAIERGLPALEAELGLNRKRRKR